MFHSSTMLVHGRKIIASRAATLHIYEVYAASLKAQEPLFQFEDKIFESFPLSAIILWSSMVTKYGCSVWHCVCTYTAFVTMTVQM
jgi:hypothetical protein